MTGNADRDPPGSSVRYGNPWADPVSERDPVRRARARLPAPVTIWTAGQADWVGLTVSSVVVAQGEPGRLVGLIGPDTDLSEMIQRTGVFVVHLLADRPEHRRLAQHFAGTLTAPPDLLQTEPSTYGAKLLTATDRLACRVDRLSPFGWSQLVEAEITEVQLGGADATPATAALAWYRGDFWHLRHNY